MKKRGISLIVLVITIIVIVVLATAIIVSLANNNPVENSKEATFKNDLSNIKDLVNLASTDILLEKEGASYDEIIPKEYEKKVYIHEGVLYYSGEAGQEEEWAKEIGVVREKDIIPEDWIDIAKEIPENGISLLIGKPELEEATIKFKVTSIGGYKVEWGDGSSASYASEAEASHTYSTNSDKLSADGYLFNVKITPESGNITYFRHTQTTDSPLLWCEIGCDTLTDCQFMLISAKNLKKFGTATNNSLNQVLNMRLMFGGCSSLTTIPLFDTSKVIDMRSMFSGCSNLKEIPKLDTSQVENINDMFRACSSLKTIPKLNTSKVTDMSGMFSGCDSLEKIPKLDTSKVTSMSAMFYGCSNLTSIPEIDTGNVTNMYNMLCYCMNLTEIPKLDTGNVTNMGWMFGWCTNLINLPEMDTKSVEIMTDMFFRCSNLETIPKFDISSATDIIYVFLACDKLKNVSIKNTGLNATQINSLFDELPNNTSGTIDIAENPGEAGCDRSKATDKGWTVIP